MQGHGRELCCVGLVSVERISAVHRCDGNGETAMIGDFRSAFAIPSYGGTLTHSRGTVSSPIASWRNRSSLAVLGKRCISFIACRACQCTWYQYTVVNLVALIVKPPSSFDAAFALRDFIFVSYQTHKAAGCHSIASYARVSAQRMFRWCGR